MPAKFRKDQITEDIVVTSGGGAIDDTVISHTSTWSSQKIDTEKSDDGHSHTAAQVGARANTWVPTIPNMTATLAVSNEVQHTQETDANTAARNLQNHLAQLYGRITLPILSPIRARIPGAFGIP